MVPQYYPSQPGGWGSPCYHVSSLLPLFSVCLSCFSEAVQSAFSSSSGGSALQIGVDLVCAWRRWVQGPPMSSSRTGTFLFSYPIPPPPSIGLISFLLECSLNLPQRSPHLPSSKRGWKREIRLHISLSTWNSPIQKVDTQVLLDIFGIPEVVDPPWDRTMPLLG